MLYVSKGLTGEASFEQSGRKRARQKDEFKKPNYMRIAYKALCCTTALYIKQPTGINSE